MIKACLLALFLLSPAAALAQDYLGLTAGLIDNVRPSTAAEIYIEDRLASFLWQRRPLADGGVAYHHPIAQDRCMFLVRPPMLTTSAETDMAAIRKESEQYFVSRDLGENQIHDMKDGSTVVLTTLANGHGQAADIYILVSPADHAVIPFATPPKRQIQVFVYWQAQKVCLADSLVAHTILSLGGGPIVENTAISSGAITTLPPVGTPLAAVAAGQDALVAARAAKDAYIESFRRAWAGASSMEALHSERLLPIADALRKIVDNSTGEREVEALLELGTVQRMQFDFATAETTLTKAAEAAETRKMHDVAFKAWVAAARAFRITRQLNEALTALERAARVAGVNPTQKERFDLAEQRSILLNDGGEAEAALVEGLDATRLAAAPEDHYFADLDVADALERRAFRCKQAPLRDSLTSDSDLWGACRRAFTAAELAYEQAARTADSQGWAALSRSSLSNRDHMAFQKMAIVESRLTSALAPETSQPAQNDKIKRMQLFAPQERQDVLATQFFDLGSDSYIAEKHPELLEQLEKVIAESEAISGGPNVDSLLARGQRAASLGKKSESMKLFTQAADMMDERRNRSFDPRRRGTVIEDNGKQLVETLALKLLALKQEDKAFALFEKFRARGLGEMVQMLARDDVTPANRAWLADLLMLEARTSKIEVAVVDSVVTQNRFEPSVADLGQLDEIRSEERSLLQQDDTMRTRLRQASYTPASLDALQKATKAADIPILFYWATNTEVIAWYVGPHGSQVRNVFLPEWALGDKLERLLQFASSPNDSPAEREAEETAARELYLFLIAPFDQLLDGNQIMIIPQGRLVNLPFETLIKPESGKPLIEHWVVSYAPNATMALNMLTRVSSPVHQVTAVADNELAVGSKEMKLISAESSLHARVLYSQGTTPAQLAGNLAGTDAVHLFLHGEFDPDEPLLSDLHDGAGHPYVYAAQLVGLPLGGVRLAVLNACESGRVAQRPSNETFGFPWALLAGGTESVVLSRWIVDKNSNDIWMAHFYTAIARGESPAVAAAAAMRAMRSEGYNHPYNWAAMQVSGR